MGDYKKFQENIEKIKLEKEAKKHEQQELEQKRQLERSIIEKVKKIVKVSNTISLDMMRRSLNLPEEIFLERIYDWAAEFNFKIDGSNLLINQDTLENFITSLDKQYEEWGKKEAGKQQKLE